MEFVEEKDGWVKVRQAGWVKNSCVTTFPLYDVAVEMWVKKKSLTTVVTKPTTIKLKGKTEVTLRPGVPIVGGKATLQNGWSIPVKVPKGSSDTRFRTEKPPKLGTRRFEKSKKGILVGGKRYTYKYEFSLIADSMKEVGKKTKATAVTQCAEVTGFFDDIFVPKDQKGISNILGALSGGGGLGILSSGNSRNRFVANKGAQVMWRDGSRAGEVTGYFHVDDPPVGVDLYCKSFRPFASETKGSPTLDLCVNRKEMKKEDPKRIAQGFGGLGLRGSGVSKKKKAPQDLYGVTFADFSVSGGLQTNDIENEIKQSVGAFRHCHIEAVEKGLKRASTYTVSVTVSDGKPTRSVVDSLDPKAKPCVEAILNRLRFVSTSKTTDASFKVKIVPK
jgi:hypothetical protein